ncbi:MAG: hypothetical protein AABX02_03425, partial [archaeon]
MKRTRVKIHHSLLDSELWLVLGILGLAILTPSWVAGHFLLFQEEGLTIQAGTPNQEAEYSSGSIIHFYLTLINPTGTVSTQLYFWKEGEQPTVIHSLAVRQGIFSYDLDTISLEDGVYHWYVEAYPFDAATVVTPTYTLYLGDTPIPSVGSGSIPEPSSGNEGTGPGGHQSDQLGEKTGFFFPLTSGEKTTVSFSNRKTLHRVRSLTITAVDPIPRGNTFIVHQEFERFSELFHEGGVE